MAAGASLFIANCSWGLQQYIKIVLIIYALINGPSTYRTTDLPCTCISTYPYVLRCNYIDGSINGSTYGPCTVHP